MLHPNRSLNICICYHVHLQAVLHSLEAGNLETTKDILLLYLLDAGKCFLDPPSGEKKHPPHHLRPASGNIADGPQLLSVFNDCFRCQSYPEQGHTPFPGQSTPSDLSQKWSKGLIV